MQQIVIELADSVSNCMTMSSDQMIVVLWARGRALVGGLLNGYKVLSVASITSRERASAL